MNDQKWIYETDTMTSKGEINQDISLDFKSKIFNENVFEEKDSLNKNKDFNPVKEYNSKFSKLPSELTLKDITNFIENS